VKQIRIGLWELCVPAAVLALLGLSSCSGERSQADVSAFFERGRIGSSPDVGLYKLSPLRGEWDLVSIVFGMADDQGFCQSLAEQLETKFANESYSCRPVNR